MTLKPTDMLQIQSAIDQYERKFPRRPAPTAEEALAWKLGKREWARRQAAEKGSQQGDPEPPSGGQETPFSMFALQECNRLAWAWDRFRLKWQTWSLSDEVPTSYAGSMPWVKTALLVGWWGVVAALVICVFFFGAMVGGFK